MILAPDSKPDWHSDVLASKIKAFISEQTGKPVEVSDFRRFTAGLSWVTISFRAVIGTGPDAEQLHLILRIGDTNGLLAPYTAWPEFVVLDAMEGLADLPLPKAYWYCDDAAVIGAPFLISALVAGDTPLPTWGTTPGAQKAPDKSAMLDDFVNGMVAIHKFQWENTDVAGLTPGVTAQNATALEIDKWITHARGGQDRAPENAIHFAGEWLKAHAKPAPRVCVVHGDYRVGNYLALDGRITAILDWELVHLGDPHEDIAWAGMRTFGGTETTFGGLLDRQAFYQRYVERTGWDIDFDAIRYFEVLSQFKMAAMLVGAERRIQQGVVHDIRLAVMALQGATTLMGLLSMIKAAS